MPLTSYEYKEKLIKEQEDIIKEIDKEIEELKDIKKRHEENAPAAGDTDIERFQKEINDLEDEASEVQKKIERLENTSAEELLKRRFG